MTRQVRLTVVLVLNLVQALIAVGYFAHFLGVLAEGTACLADPADGVSLLAIALSKRSPTPAPSRGIPGRPLSVSMT